MTTRHPLHGFMLAPLAVMLATPAFAGRPLSVDDAGTNAAGEGHVEVWMSRADGVRSTNISPAYALSEGLELSALLSRLTPEKLTGTALQLKYLFSPSKEDGCNLGASIGLARASASGESANASFINGIASCNGTPVGNIHLNLGATKASGAKAVKSWGVALERSLGAVTPHIEYFGIEHSKPAVQIGLRGDIAKTVQLDGTMGRSAGVTAYSVGLKFRF